MKKFDRNITIYQRKLLFIILLFGAGILLLASSIGVYGHIRSVQTQEEAITRENPTVAASSPLPLYILREYEQKIGIFEAGEITPVQVLDVYVFTLPETDQIALKSGIRIFSDDALQARIEDFTG